jgi:hypothetical protein
MTVSLKKEQINADAQYCVVLSESTQLQDLPDLRLPAGDPIILIGRAAIELYSKLTKISLVDEERTSAE